MMVRVSYFKIVLCSYLASTVPALVGGVYYVRVPAWSGRLEMYDPRGKSPLRDLEDPTSPPLPPFHRVRAVLPEEGEFQSSSLVLVL
jgi:hypothetical protein